MNQRNQRACIVVLLSLSILGAASCKKKRDDQTGSGATTAAKTGSGATSAAKAELADAAEPAGVTWKRIEMPFGSLELPVDPGWNLVGTEVQGQNGIVITMQSQDGITPEQLDDYLASYDEVQKRDAPKYVGTSTTKGTVSGAVAARVEGTFDNGTAFVTRDFLVAAIGARIPKANAAALPGIIDHAVRTLQLK
jgi:flagellar basal body L-ring protein FlgH